VLLGILREEKCVAAEILHERGLRLNAIREELARFPMQILVPDADTAKRIAEALWTPQYGADTVASQAPIKAELKFNVWIVTGSSSTEPPLFSFIPQTDGRILSVGGPTKP